MDLRQMHKAAYPLTKAIGALVAVLALSSCTAIGWIDGPSGRSCKAYCSTLAPDGETCVRWSAGASDACVGKYTAVNWCCNPSGTRMCRMQTQGAEGFGCYCQGFGPYGPFAVQGVACR